MRKWPTALLFSLCVTLFPWSSLFQSVYGYNFLDLEVYKNYFTNEENIIHYKSFDHLISYFTNEYIWHYSIDYLLRKGIDLDSIFFSISFFCIFIFSNITIKYLPTYSLLFLINPLLIDLAFSQLRNALAISILGSLIIWPTHRKWLTPVICITALSIHTSSIIFIAIYLSIKAIDTVAEKKNLSSSNIYLSLLFTGITFAIILGPMREFILTFFNDRRSTYSNRSLSIKQNIFWILPLIYFGINHHETSKHFPSKYSTVISTLVISTIFIGGYPSRLIASSLPLLISSILKARGVFIITPLSFILYAFLQWAYWLRIGIGIGSGT